MSASDNTTNPIASLQHRLIAFLRVFGFVGRDHLDTAYLSASRIAVSTALSSSLLAIIGIATSLAGAYPEVESNGFPWTGDPFTLCAWVLFAVALASFLLARLFRRIMASRSPGREKDKRRFKMEQRMKEVSELLSGALDCVIVKSGRHRKQALVISRFASKSYLHLSFGHADPERVMTMSRILTCLDEEDREWEGHLAVIRKSACELGDLAAIWSDGFGGAFRFTLEELVVIDWAQVERAARALGVDLMVESYYAGVPLDHIISG